MIAPYTALYALVLILPLTGLWAQDWPSAQATTDLLRQAAGALPNFQLNPDIRTYTRENLYQYINGDADRYFAYDYQWTVAAIFKDTRAGVNLGADVFRFSTDLDAFGAFSMDRDPNIPGELIPLGGQVSAVSAFWAGNQLHVWRGPLYVRFVPAARTDSLRTSVLELAQVVIPPLSLPRTDPPIFRLPPPRDLILESVKFQRRNVLGQAFLANALTASYGRRTPERKLDITLEMLLFDGRDAGGAERVYSALAGLLVQGAALTPVVAMGDACFVARHLRFGVTYVMRESGYVVMLMRVKNPEVAEALLREVGHNIRSQR